MEYQPRDQWRGAAPAGSPVFAIGGHDGTILPDGESVIKVAPSLPVSQHASRFGSSVRFVQKLQSGSRGPREASFLEVASRHPQLSRFVPKYLGIHTDGVRLGLAAKDPPAAYAMCSLLDWPHAGPHSSADDEEWIRMENLVHALSKVVAHCQAVCARAEPKSCERL